jgi:hypothetical protein
MEVHINEIELVNQIANGDYRLFNCFYSKDREQFFRSFTNECIKTETETGYVRPKFKRGDLYLDELYQDSNMRMIEKIRNGRLYVKDDCLYIVNKSDEHKAYSSGLYKYLYQIGIYVLREMERSESKNSVLDIDDFLKNPETDDDNDISTFEMDFLIDTFEEEDERISLVRKIVKSMQEPCKGIFRLTYFGNGEKKMKGEDIARELGMLNADTVRAQRSKCLKKFKVTFEKENRNR